MKKELFINIEHEVLSLVTDITYSYIPDWYNAVYTDLKMNLIIPKYRTGHKKMPAIVWICGGAYSVVSNSAWMPEMMYFARRGYVIASIEYRTSNKASFPAGIIDVKSAIRFLKVHAEDFCIDPKQIFVMGESAGGTYAVLAGVSAGKQKEWEQGDNLTVDSQVAGVVDFYGPVDFSISSVVKNDIVPSWTLQAFYGDNCSQEDIEKASPLNYVDFDAPPFLILHGTEDATVPIVQGDRLYEKLIQHNVYVEYYKIKGAGHGEDYFYQDQVKERIAAFLDRIVNQPK